MSTEPTKVEYPLDEKIGPPPKWVPLSMFTVTTAAIGIPLILLLRIRRGLGPSVPLTAANATPSTRALNTSSASIPTSNTLAQTSSSAPLSTPPTETMDSSQDGDDPNMAFLAFRAFSVATLWVASGALVTVFGVRQYLGVNTVSEFAQEMRLRTMRQLPSMTERINQPASSSFSETREADSWDWESARSRMRTAYETQGFNGWFNTAMKELEVEAELLRRQREQQLEQRHSKQDP